MSSTTDKIKKNQERLHAKKNAEGLKKWKNGGGANKDGQESAVKRYESYRREEQLPREVEQRRVSCHIVNSHHLTADLRRRAEADNHLADLWLCGSLPCVNNQKRHQN